LQSAISLGLSCTAFHGICKDRYKEKRIGHIPEMPLLMAEWMKPLVWSPFTCVFANRDDVAWDLSCANYDRYLEILKKPSSWFVKFKPVWGFKKDSWYLVV
jgi:hypothetical protein